ncbi:beta-lactamase [Pseudidiomarina salinarum]|uniref:Beta-lactamase n=2 Tax=Pseudidiomarina salinarum TaxID=435908 RepID=A0A094IWJ3_9GAMM|nr:beta-lactamase [Pseudidiomarina salinarum]
MLTAGLAVAGTAVQATPEDSSQAPGYYRMPLGDFMITALSDGTVDLPMHNLLHLDAAEVHQRLAKDYLESPLETSLNGFLIDTGDKQVLVDTGAGSMFGPTLGKLPQHLQAAGYQTNDIDVILITHMHPDHVGGLVRDGERLYPNAKVYVHRDDANYWLDEAHLNAAPEGQKDFFRGAMAALQPYQESGQLSSFTGVTEILPGFVAHPTVGHTPGHSGYHVSSAEQTMVFWGDVIHVAAIQFADPEVTIDFDTDSAVAKTVRQGVFSSVAKEGYWAAGAHLSFPGIGHLATRDKGYRWIPANYTTQFK